MYSVVVNTSNFFNEPKVYQDIDCTEEYPAILPFVQGFKGTLRVYFVGDNVPTESQQVRFGLRPSKGGACVYATEFAERNTDESGNVYYDLTLSASTAELEGSLYGQAKGSYLACFLVVGEEDEPETRTEWQFACSVSRTVLAGRLDFEVTPTACAVMKAMIEEIQKVADGAVETAEGAVSTAESASETAQEALTNSQTALSNSESAVSSAESAVATATEAKESAESAVSSAEGAVSSAEGAVATAEEAKATAEEAKATAETAESNSTSAIATATSASETAGTALSNSESAVADATSAKESAESAVSSASEALTTAQTAEANATSAKESAESAVASAESANATAQEALTTAQSANETAETALTTAQTAETNSESAVATATSASGNASTALENSESAVSTAESASETATEAKELAESAVSDATSAKTTAESASETANTASGNAQTALTTANEASETATSASETAEEALTTAQTAETNSESALTTAESAVSTANTAETVANSAKLAVDANTNAFLPLWLDVATTGKTASVKVVGGDEDCVFTVDGEELTIGAGKMVYFNCDSLTVANGFKSIVGAGGLQVSLTGITSPESVYWAFPQSFNRGCFPNVGNSNSYTYPNLIDAYVAGGKPTTLYRAFYGCSSLTTLDVSAWDLSACTNFQGAFYNCSSLTTLDTSNWDLSACTNFQGAFSGCSKLANIGPLTNAHFSISFSSCPLTRESALNIMNGVYDYTGAGETTTETITFSSTTKALLSDDDIAIATDKGWTVA